MTGSFSIPGLGSAKPNEKLPTSNFAPDTLAAAAGVGEPSQGHQQDAEQKRQSEEIGGNTSPGDAGEAALENQDAMEVDGGTGLEQRNPANTKHPRRCRTKPSPPLRAPILPPDRV